MTKKGKDVINKQGWITTEFCCDGWTCFMDPMRNTMSSYQREDSIEFDKWCPNQI